MGSGTYTVSTDPVEARTYHSDKGNKDLTVWRLGLEGVRSTAEDQLFELHKVKGNAPPPKGMAIEVERSMEGDFNGEKFTRLFLRSTYQEGGSSGGGGARQRASGEGPGLQWQDKPYQSSATHPRDEVRMIRTSALSSAPSFIDQMLTMPDLAKDLAPKTAAEYWALVDRVVARIEASYRSALGAYDQRVSPQQQLPEAEVPADTDGLSEEQRAHDASLPF